MRTELYAAALLETWAIRQDWLTAHLALTGDVAWTKRMPSVSGKVAILPMHGAISQRSSVWQEMFGGTSTQAFGAAFVRAINDDRIGAIVIDQDSPGGTTAGVEELGDIIHKGSKIKPVVAVANSESDSAAYWLGSQATTFVAAPGAQVGSVGVYRMHADESKMMEDMGVKVQFMAVPEHKVEGNPYQPLGDDAIAHHMEQVNQTYDVFTGAVARGRGVPQSKVKSSFGKGRSFHAQQAKDLGMVDRVATLGDIIRELGGNGKADIVTSIPTHGSEFEIDAVSGECKIETPLRGLLRVWESGQAEAMRIPMSRQERTAALLAKI